MRARLTRPDFIKFYVRETRTMGKYALKRDHHTYKAEAHYQPNGKQWRYRSSIRRGIRSNKGGANAQRRALTFTLSTFKYL